MTNKIWLLVNTQRYAMIGVTIAGAIAVLFAALHILKIAIPDWIETISWLVVTVLIGIAIIKFKFVFKKVES
jgi:hypothetical protein